MSWIKWVIGLENKPEVIQIAAEVGIHREWAAAKLMKLWGWLDENVQEKCVDASGWATLRLGPSESANCATLDEIVGLSGFASAMVHAGWLQARSAVIRIPNYKRHNGSTSKTRALNSLRQKALRSGEKDEEKPVTILSRSKRDNSSLLFSSSSEVASRSEATSGSGADSACAPKAARKAGAKPATAVESVAELEIPAELDTSQVREALQLWIDYKQERRESYSKPAYLNRHLRKFVAGGPQGLIDSIDQAMGSMHQGFFPRAERGAPRDKQRVFDPRGTFAARDAYLEIEKDAAIDGEFTEDRQAS